MSKWTRPSQATGGLFVNLQANERTRGAASTRRNSISVTTDLNARKDRAPEVTRGLQESVNGPRGGGGREGPRTVCTSGSK